jgi:hypothetical protein
MTEAVELEPATICGVSIEHLDRAWLDSASHLASALARGCRGYTLEDVRRMLDDEKALLWQVRRGDSVAASVVCYPDQRGDCVHIWLMGGEEMEGWIDALIKALRRYARDEKLSALQAEVRPGLGRVLNRRGWQIETTCVRVPVWAD